MPLEHKRGHWTVRFDAVLNFRVAGEERRQDPHRGFCTWAFRYDAKLGCLSEPTFGLANHRLVIAATKDHHPSHDALSVKCLFPSMGTDLTNCDVAFEAL
jgi:hypothetical protein